MEMPDRLPQWATDTNYPAGAAPEAGAPIKVEPTSAKKAVGWRPSELPPAQYLNWWMELVHRWIDWLSSLHRPFFQLHQNWCAPMLDAWTTGASNGGTVTKVVNPAANKMGVWLLIRAPGGANAHASKYSETVCGGPWPSTMLAVLEFDIDASALVEKDVQAKFGLVHDEGLFPSTEDFVMIYKSKASPNWIFRTGSPDGTQKTTNTGVAPSGVQRMRIETYGSGWPGGARALLYINDALEATHTTNLPADDEMKVFAGFANNGVVGADVDVYVSPMTFLMRRLVP
jgi:hypothetical protein